MERKVLFSELAALVEKDYELNGYRSAADIELRHRLHILPFFGKMKAARISESDIDDYILKRRGEEASNATINRELVTIKRAYSLGIQKRIVSDGRIFQCSKRTTSGRDFSSANNTSDQKASSRICLASGGLRLCDRWRKSEILSLQWRQVDFEAGNVRLEPGTTKNREAGSFPSLPSCGPPWRARRKKRAALAKEGKICPWVFHRKGKPIGEFKHSWKTACTKAGLPGRLMHDFRRTAVRNLVRAGVPERVAMKMTGHKTRSVFERYNIVSEGDSRTRTARWISFRAKTRAKTGKIQKSPQPQTC